MLSTAQIKKNIKKYLTEGGRIDPMYGMSEYPMNKEEYESLKWHTGIVPDVWFGVKVIPPKEGA